MKRLRSVAAVFRWPVIGALFLTAVGLGVVGFLRQASLLGEEMSLPEAAYRTIQLFVLEWGGVADPMPITLQFARFAAPLVAGLAAAKAAAVLFRVELERLWVRLFGRGHVVVCGLGSKGWRLSAALRQAGWRVASIDLTEPQRPVSDWAFIVGDATDPDTLLRAGGHRARHLVALCGDDSTNIAVARAAQEIGRDGSTVHVMTSQPDLAALLRSETYRSLSDPAPSIEFFTLEDRGSRILLDSLDAQPDRLVTTGSSLLAERVITEAMRRWPTIEVDRATTPADQNVIDSVLGIRSLILIADGEGSDGLSASLRLVHDLKAASFGAQGGTCDIFALSEYARNLGDLVAPTHGPNSAIRLHAFDLDETLLTADLLEGGTRESIARALHEAYRMTAARDATPLPPWEGLDDASREASRVAANGIGALFLAVGCDLVAAPPQSGEALVLLPSEVELMAMLEHDRWLTWTASRRSPSSSELRHDWFELADDARERSAAVIRLLPAVLRDIGQRVVRLERSPARNLHSDYFARRAAAGDTIDSNPSLVPWDRLPISLQDSNRDQLAHLRVKLRAIGLDLRPGPGPAIKLTPEQVERLSEMEHERWVRHRRFDGWMDGDTKDPNAKVTPHLVPWSDLDEATRETDRAFVRSIPDLAAALGQHIVGR